MRRKKLIVIFSILAAVVLVIFLGGMFFSVDPQKVTAYCYNSQDADLEKQVAASAEVKRQSIFFLSEKKLSAQIDETVNSSKTIIKIINIERLFPDRVSINFVKVIPFIYVPLGEQFVVCDNTGRVVEITQAESSRLIKTTLKGEITASAVNGILATSVSGEVAVITAIMDALDRLNYRTYNTINLVESIDASNLEHIVIQTRSGTAFEIIGTARLAEKMQMAVSVYSENDPVHKTGGVVVVYEESQSRKIKGEWQP